MNTNGSMISPALEQAINAQVGREFEASMQYVNIASYFDAESLPELAAFFFRQSDEERDHAMKFVHYVLETGGSVRVPALEAARYDFTSAEDAVAAALAWEIEVTQHINDLMDIAIDARDHIAQQFLQWFVAEQREEVSTMSTLRDVVKRAGPDGLLFVEQYLSRATLGEAGPSAGA